jgi:hypothetical protein
MSATRWLRSLACCALVALPASAADPGRREFPLKYRLAGSSVTREIGYGGQHLRASPAKPTALKEEPAYQSSAPLYSTIRLGANKDTFVVALDNSRGDSRGHDILYVDADGDGRLTAQEKLTGIHCDDSLTFGPVKILVDCGGEKCPQWFLFRYAEQVSDDGKNVYRRFDVVNAGYYQGVVAFGDTKCLVAFGDVNANGLYHDLMSQDEWTADRLLLDHNGDGKLDGGHQSEESQPLGRCVQVGGRYWRLEVAADGSAVTVEPLNKPVGTIRAAVADYTLLLKGDDGVLHVRSKDGTAAVPAGSYRLVRCSYQVQQQDKRWQFIARAGEHNKAIEVPADGVAPIPFGPPFVPKVKARPSATDLGLDLELRGAGGEIYDSVYCGQEYQQPPVPKVRILDANDRELALLDFHYG